MLLISKPHITYRNPPDNRKSEGVAFFFLLFIVNSVYGLWAADTYHVWESFKQASLYAKFELISYEEIYNWLGGITGNHYFLWRLFIWLPACFFMYFTASILDLRNRNFLLALALFAGFAAYTRGMLGHSMMLFGAVLYMKNNKIRLKSLGIVFVVISYFFHKSMFVNILFALIAIYPFGKKIIQTSFIAFPFFTFVATFILNSIILGFQLVPENEIINNTALIYASEERSKSNTIGIIAKIIQYLPEYLTIIYLYNRIIVKKYLSGVKNEKTFNYLFRLTYVSIYISSLFLFVESSNWIYLRFKYMAFFPLVFILGKIWNLEPKSNKWIKSIIFFQIFALLYKYMYLLYQWMKL